MWLGWWLLVANGRWVGELEAIWRVFAVAGKVDWGLARGWDADGDWFLIRKWHSAGGVLWVLGA